MVVPICRGSSAQPLDHLGNILTSSTLLIVAKVLALIPLLFFIEKSSLILKSQKRARLLNSTIGDLLNSSLEV